VAEGVEERADWDLLRTLGCDVAQGYLIARPMPGNDLPAWWKAWQPRRVELTGSAP
jgi:EAL domain-containing protein (putative c-di-GMP-specific phosphodiesterase class I)